MVVYCEQRRRLQAVTFVELTSWRYAQGEGYHGPYRKDQTGELAGQAVAADDGGRRGVARLRSSCRVTDRADSRETTAGAQLDRPAGVRAPWSLGIATVR